VNYLSIYFELFALISCAFCYKKLDNNFKIFLPFLVFIVLYEFANVYNWLLIHHTNAWCNSLEGIVELAVLGYFIPSLDKRASYRKKAYAFVIAGIAFSFVDFFFIQGIWQLNTIAIVLQNTILAILVCVYYYNLINNTDDHLDLLHYPPFYATIGLLFYSLTNFFYYAVFSYMVYKNNYEFYILARVLTDLGCIFIYSLLAVSFLCFLRTKKLSSY
jgi:hypothetical protein